MTMAEIKKEENIEALLDKLVVVYKLKFEGVEKDKDKLKQMHPVELMVQIDIVVSEIEAMLNRFRKEKKKGEAKNSRVKWLLVCEDIERQFGTWSNSFNKVLRGRIKELKDVQDEDFILIRQKLQFVYAYWWNTYHLFTGVLTKKSQMAVKFKKKHIMKGRETLMKLIMGEVDLSLISSQFKKLIEDLNSTNFTFEDKK